jgi:class 3 adenylate cyclase
MPPVGASSRPVNMYGCVMRGKDKRRGIKLSIDDIDMKTAKVSDITAGVRKVVAARIAEKYAEDPKKFARLIEVGLVDEKTLRSLPDDLDYAAAVQQFKERLGVMASEEPSVLGRLEIRPLDVLYEEQQTGETDSPRANKAVVFSDLEGFTAYTSQQGDTEASALLSDHYDAVESIVRGRGGAVLKTIGDGHMLSFGEERAAVLAGVELAGLAAGPLRVRVGAHNGEVVTAENDLFGHVVNVAARITDLAAGGESLVTTSLRDVAGTISGVEFDQPNTTYLRGIEDPYDLCRARHS